MFKSIILLLLFFSSIFAKNENVTLVLSWKHQFQFAGYYMAIEKGFYKDVNIDVTLKEYDFEHDNAKEVSLRKYEFGIKHSPLILDRLTKYKNLKFMAVINQSSPLILISTKYSNFENLPKMAHNLG